MGHRGVPLHASAVALHTSAILGHLIGEQWVHRFHLRHPDIKTKWTSNLEKCRAQALNPAAAQGFYDILEEVRDKYGITEENTYNMDEKGVQMGIGGSVHALVDCDQKVVQQVEDGD